METRSILPIRVLLLFLNRHQFLLPALSLFLAQVLLLDSRARCVVALLNRSYPSVPHLFYSKPLFQGFFYWLLEGSLPPGLLSTLLTLAPVAADLPRRAQSRCH
jgi:hypothetical protein